MQAEGGMQWEVVSFWGCCLTWPSSPPFHPQVKNNEEGLRFMESLSHSFRDVHLWWMGPIYPLLRFVHPKFVAPLLQAPGISPGAPDPAIPLSLFPVLGTSGQTRLSREVGSIDGDMPLTCWATLGRSLALSGSQSFSILSGGNSAMLV